MRQENPFFPCVHAPDKHFLFIDIICVNASFSYFFFLSLFFANQANSEFNVKVKKKVTNFGHGSDLISMCQRCSSSLCLFSTAFCFCFFSLLSCSFLARLLGLISTGSSGFTFFYRDERRTYVLGMQQECDESQRTQDLAHSQAIPSQEQLKSTIIFPFGLPFTPGWQFYP